MYGRDQKVKHLNEIYVLLVQGLANFFCKGSDSQYFRPCGPYRLLGEGSKCAGVQKQLETICEWLETAVFQYSFNFGH